MSGVDIAARFGDNLRRERKLAGLSQDEVSWRASLHRTEVSQLERGLRLCRVDTIAKVAGALEIDPGRLFQGIVWEPGDVQYGRLSRRRLMIRHLRLPFGLSRIASGLGSIFGNRILDPQVQSRKSPLNCLERA